MMRRARASPDLSDAAGEDLVTATVGPTVASRCADWRRTAQRARPGFARSRRGSASSISRLAFPDPSNPNGPQTEQSQQPRLVGSLGGGGGTFTVTCAVNNAKTLLQVAPQWHDHCL